MKIAILTTQTPHHTFFVQELHKVFPVDLVLVEQRKVTPPFDTHHTFEGTRDRYEEKVWFGDASRTLRDMASVAEVHSINDPDALNHLDQVQPSVIISFGAGKIGKEVITRCPHGIINLHGGDPQEYRGLDSHLWAIYHKDFSHVVATLHRLNEHLDDGEIIAQAPVPVSRGMKIHELRGKNTEVCVALTLKALAHYRTHGQFTSFPQQKRGRYYSFMPAPLKQIAKEYFERYTGTLPV